MASMYFVFPPNSSVSLTSLDSEEQESLRANERLHNRTNRNSTGGISTHSLNEAELAVKASLIGTQKRRITQFSGFDSSVFSATLKSSTQRGTLRRRFVAFRCKNPSRHHQSHPFKMPKKKTTYRE